MKRLGVYLKPYTLESILGPLFKLLEALLELLVPLVVADIIDTYVYRIGITDGEFGIATALGLIKSVIGFALILIVNKVTNKLGGVGVW